MTRDPPEHRCHTPPTKRCRVCALVGGWHDSDLTSAGQKAAAEIARVLRAAIPKDTQVDLFSSDLRRTAQTADQVAEVFGVRPIMDRRLRAMYFHGRRDDLFEQRGVRTSAAEIEAAALRAPEVRDAAVVPSHDRRGAVPFVATALSPDELVRRLHAELEAAKIPAVCRVLPRLPVGSTGKTDRTALRALVDDTGGDGHRA
ncbi:hypothetical protein GCM10022384_02090 [Streptomyces marokkonensis]|uniref:AMP-binding enzyme C-terminal domain-containing protein n=1 Tax=Streptomyces marokkonensis TaxID=324855 RepID=A0ABP7NRD2_9ACTN